jgi:hypothetical protein
MGNCLLFDGAGPKDYRSEVRRAGKAAENGNVHQMLTFLDGAESSMLQSMTEFVSLAGGRVSP